MNIETLKQMLKDKDYVSAGNLFFKIFATAPSDSETRKQAVALYDSLSVKKQNLLEL